MTLGVLGRPLVAIVPRDVPLPAPIDRQITGSSERALFRGYSGGAELDRIEPRPCACGGLIDPGYETEIQAAIDRHSAERRHLAWRERQG